MSADEPLAPEPAGGSLPLASSLLTAVIAFAGGAAVTGALAWYRPWHTPAPVAQPAPQPSPTPLPVAPPGTDLATLWAREQALAGRLDQIDARLREVDSGARAAAGHATQAERLMIAFAVRRAIERGLPLGPLEPQLRRRFGESHSEAVAAIVQTARQPMTLEDLRQALDGIAPRLSTPAGSSWWGSARLLLGDLVVLRRDGVPSPRPADRLKRARRTLDQGQVEAALAEVTHMPGVGNAESWVAAARRYIAARTALREIEAAAMDAPPAPAGTG